jgi:glycosyltransferase involved in cell wall biosynthesis
MFISIITVNLNNKDGLHKTLESLKRQTSSFYELIVIDGMSIDGSVELIENYKGFIHNCIIEPDNGTYDAMNKGVKLASGDYLLMLNSGDVLAEPDTLEKIISRGLKEDIIFSDVIWDDGKAKYNSSFPDQLTLKYFLTDSIGHQAVFYRRSLHDIVGLYRTDFKICSDAAFLVNALFRHNCSYRKYDTPVSVCQRGGISADPLNAAIVYSERMKFISEDFKNLLAEIQYGVFLEKELNSYRRFKKTLLYRIFKRLHIIK